MPIRKALSTEVSRFESGTSCQSFMDDSRTTPKPGTLTNKGVATQTTRRLLEESSGSHNSRSAGVQLSLREEVPPGSVRSTLQSRVMKYNAQASVTANAAARAISRGCQVRRE